MGHDAHSPGAPASGVLPGTVLPAFALLLLAGSYVALSRRARRCNPVQGWSPWRTACFLAGAALLAVALLPPVAAYAHHDFRGHMAQHMLIGMYAPLALVLGAPVTLLLRTLPTAHGRRLTRVLHSRPARVATRPAVALLLSAGTLVALYVTPLYNTAMGHPAGHWLMNAHFLLAGLLFAHVMAGPDPAPSRPGVRVRLVCLGVAIAVHAVLSQMIYGGFWTDVHAPVDQVRGGAELMYYGGDIAELLLAAALVATWRPTPRARPRGSGAARRVPA
ncbi:cytochrome c oxidase assembly protein [Streptomyces sp. NPDC005899]|uniref:cytochrome c oxidase assembly protein n=1 Tax=Streptomyces sp. NPDC005899 TaxID=3155716 RepID=UPI0034108DAF